MITEAKDTTEYRHCNITNNSLYFFSLVASSGRVAPPNTFAAQRRISMTEKREDVVVNDLIEIQELERKVAPNIVWST